MVVLMVIEINKMVKECRDDRCRVEGRRASGERTAVKIEGKEDKETRAVETFLGHKRVKQSINTDWGGNCNF